MRDHHMNGLVSDLWDFIGSCDNTDLALLNCINAKWRRRPAHIDLACRYLIECWGRPRCQHWPWSDTVSVHKIEHVVRARCAGLRIRDSPAGDVLDRLDGRCRQDIPVIGRPGHVCADDSGRGSFGGVGAQHVHDADAYAHVNLTGDDGKFHVVINPGVSQLEHNAVLFEESGPLTELRCRRAPGAPLGYSKFKGIFSQRARRYGHERYGGSDDTGALSDVVHHLLPRPPRRFLSSTMRTLAACRDMFMLAGSQEKGPDRAKVHDRPGPFVSPEPIARPIEKNSFQLLMITKPEIELRRLGFVTVGEAPLG